MVRLDSAGAGKEQEKEARMFFEHLGQEKAVEADGIT